MRHKCQSKFQAGIQKQKQEINFTELYQTIPFCWGGEKNFLRKERINYFYVYFKIISESYFWLDYGYYYY